MAGRAAGLIGLLGPPSLGSPPPQPHSLSERALLRAAAPPHRLFLSPAGEGEEPGGILPPQVCAFRPTQRGPRQLRICRWSRGPRSTPWGRPSAPRTRTPAAISPSSG